jgi:YD repeat-containing protein
MISNLADDADRITAESFGSGFTTQRTYFDEEKRLESIHTIKGAELVQALE